MLLHSWNPPRTGSPGLLKTTAYLLLLQAVKITSATLCYTPDGTISNDVPCWWDGTDGNPLQFIRGTCTDKSWSSSLCPGRCVAESVSGGEWVMRCGNTTNNYCCSADDCCTNKSFSQFSLDEPTVTATAGVVPSTTVHATTTTSAPTTTSASTTSSPTQTASDDSSGGDSSNSKSKTIGIGVGVGVGGGVALLGLLGGFLFMRRRKAKQAVPPQHPPLPVRYEAQGSFPHGQKHLPPQELDSQDPRVLAELQGTTGHT
ncbi:hypothetical protein ABOM_010523 [Aspergillus bombycis]|uniref:Mid2 domain-containing protein n=1 Tax=Aspergillus bombycis TaxID=109264 RepID=A0A1F7ZMY1_9EURO|nr:hypothetical protein ABOM_010523 [Aspergillus bombycis]OGM40817.1 hypothetical protein ABOM_010523 [Aspergillus bombycis]